MSLNIFSLTALFMATGLPSSSSAPAMPPSPDRSSSLRLISSSSLVTVLALWQGSPPG